MHKGLLVVVYVSAEIFTLKLPNKEKFNSFFTESQRVDFVSVD